MELNVHSVATIVAAFTDASCKKILFDVKEKLPPGLIEYMLKAFNVPEDEFCINIVREGAYEFLVFEFESPLEHDEVYAMLPRINQLFYNVSFHPEEYLIEEPLSASMNDTPSPLSNPFR